MKSIIFKTKNKFKKILKKIYFKKIYNLSFIKEQDNEVYYSIEGVELFQSSNDWAVFASYNRDGEVNDDVLYYLEKLYRLKFNIIFVTTSKNLSDEDVDRLSQVCHKIIHRKNVGYDFGSWITGLDFVPNGCDGNVVFCNDSVYGPLFDLSQLLQKFEESGCMAYGVTDSYEINHHMQSYFMVFKKRLVFNFIKDNCFDNYRFFRSKEYAIWNGELNLSAVLRKHEIPFDVYCPYGSIIPNLTVDDLKNFNSSDFNLNSTHFFWKELITQFKIPFLKKELFHLNPMGVNNVSQCSSVVNEKTEYPVSLLRKD